MILKEIDPKQTLDKFQKAGHEAEKQMCFYLKRAFQDDTEIQVINDLRLQSRDDVAQIDHLVVHRFGFIIIESKSVTSEISVNRHGEWIRHYQSTSKGIPSPVNQAQRQAEFLKKFLTARDLILLKKRVILKNSMSIFKYDTLVAISDSGIITREDGINMPEVLKADQITDRIKSIITGYAKTNNAVFSLTMHPHFGDESFSRVTNHLLKSHRPANLDPLSFQNEPSTDEPIEPPSFVGTGNFFPQNAVVPEKIKAQPKCQKCSSTNIIILHGKYGYYFKCSDCNGNSAIKLTCNKPICKPKLRKEKNQFYKECAECGVSELFFENGQ